MRTRVIQRGNKFVPQYAFLLFFWRNFTYVEHHIGCNGPCEKEFEFDSIEDAIDYCLKQMKPSQNNNMTERIVWESHPEPEEDPYDTLY